jgi:hypothetical protein
MEQRWNYIDRGKQDLGKTCPGAALPTTDPTQTALGANPVLYGEKPVTNRLCYGTAMSVILQLHLPARYE